jgi:hypothetical protein
MLFTSILCLSNGSSYREPRWTCYSRQLYVYPAVVLIESLAERVIYVSCMSINGSSYREPRRTCYLRQFYVYPTVVLIESLVERVIYVSCMSIQR